MRQRGLTVSRTTDAKDLEAWEDLARHFRSRLRESSIPREIFDQLIDHLEEFRGSHKEDSESTFRPPH